MALTTTYSRAALTAKVQALAALLEGGFLDLYAGEQPATADSPVKGQARLAHVPFARPAFQKADRGLAWAYPLTDATAEVTGTATWFRLTGSDGAAIADGSVGVSNANLNLLTVDLVKGMMVRIGAFQLEEVSGG